MATVVPDPKSIRAFKTEPLFERWLAANHAKQGEIYLRIFKKGSGVASVTHAQALDVALCWGWIDAIRKSFDERSFLQRFTPRKPKSLWSQINREHVARLIAAGRMQAQGLAQVEAAKADGRWEAAYVGSAKLVVPADLLAAIQAEPEAHAFFGKLSKQNVYALVFRLDRLKTAAARERNIAQYVDMLRRGQAFHPQGKRT